MRRDVDVRIAELKRRVATLEGDDFERVFRELQVTMNELRDLGTRARRETFLRIVIDDEFDERRFLSFVSADSPG